MLQRLGIRGKILAVVAVPVLVLLLAAGYITLQATNALGAATNAQQLVATANAAKPFQAAFNVERDAAANFVNTFAGYSSNRIAAQDSIATSAAGLQIDNAAAYTELQQIFEGGQDTESGGTAMSLDDARAVAPTQPVETDWYVWPSAEDSANAAESVAAIGLAVQALADDESGDSAATLDDIAFALSQEAAATQDFLTIPQTYQTTFLDAVDDSDNTWAELLKQMDAVGNSATNESVIAMISTVKDQMRDLDDTREDIRTIGNSAATLSQWYANALHGINDVINRSTIAVGDPDLSIELTAYGAIYNLLQQLSEESTTVQRILRQGEYLIGDATAARNQIAATDFALDQAQSAATALGSEVTVPDWGASTSTTSNFNFQSVRNTVATGDTAALATIADVNWVGMVDAEATAQEPAYDQTIAMATIGADDLRQAALVQTIATAFAAIAAVALTVVVALLIARRIVVPLRRLTTTATAVRAELPRLVERVAIPGESVDVSEVQIPVESRDEVGRLAEAFNGVNAATLAIAAEQAALRGSISEMFVNVARRDQVLLNRQLASIDDMERTQDDPDTLTKLFALDHLATRMRRNSESLLVLAGIDTGRRLRRAMPLSDVIRTASSEIELYERVQLELDADPAMLGHSALTTAHLFAELLENATVFSDPGSPVVVRTSERDGQYVVEIQDSGIGMNESELVEANNRVASTAASEILGAQRLGLFVVGRIARRIGARVRIESKEGVGTTAFVTMTPTLFDSTYSPDVVHHTESTVDEAMHAPAALVSHNSEDEQFDPVDTKEADSGAYRPAMAEGTPLAGRAAETVAVSALIAADAANAPSGVATEAEDLTDGVSATGLPTRRRREATVEVSEEEQKKIIGLPARATDEQLSALEAEAPAEDFAPAIPASEIAPQTPEDRAQMFRGFRSRREMVDSAVGTDPEAESLGHAARRGGLAPEDIVAANQSDALTIPVLEDDEFDSSAPDAIPVLEDDDEPALAEFHMPRLETPAADTSALDSSDDASDGLSVPLAAAAAAAMVVPVLEDDDEPGAAAAAPAAPEAVPTIEPDDGLGDGSLVAPVEEPVGEVAPAVETAAAPSGAFAAAAVPDPVQPEAVAPQAPAAPFSYADVYGSLPAPTPEPAQPAWGVDAVSLGEQSDAPEPSLDELIAGAADEEAAKSGFFARLFGRSKKSKSPSEAPIAEAAVAAAAVAAVAEPVVQTPTFEPRAEMDPVFHAPPVVEPEPKPTTTPAYVPPTDFEPETGLVAEPEPEPMYDTVANADAAPAYDAPRAYDAAPVSSPAPVNAVPAYSAPQSFEPEPSAETDPAAVVNPGGAFALWTQQQPEHRAPEPDPALAAMPSAGQAFTPDELANPFGWEQAGASALLANEPEAATEYQPVVDTHSDGTPAQEELTSQVFSEFSSLATERPKLETTRAGLQRRRSVDAPAPDVKPIEQEVQLTPKDRDADEVRSRFSSFYSGTQRARSDVAEFEQRSQSPAGKE